MPECVRLTPAKLETIDWLPSSCGYLRVHRGQHIRMAVAQAGNRRAAGRVQVLKEKLIAGVISEDEKQELRGILAGTGW